MSEAERISKEGESLPAPSPESLVTAPETTVIGAVPVDDLSLAPTGDADFRIEPAGGLTVGESESEIFVTTPFINNRYRLKRLLGRGGYATVYEAHDEILRRPVAIKVPRRERFTSKAQLDEFLTEAQTAAQLKHRMIVTVHDVGWTPEGACFIVLDYLEGGTLTQAIARKRFTPEQTARLLADVAEAVSYANQQGLVHRDLKPSNILLDSAGQPYVSDFGLAALAQSAELRNSEIVGTPPFMAPEQVRGENHRLDGRTDLWALGVILYVMLVGRLPFRKEGGDFFQEILHSDPPPPRRIDSKIPRELERICLRCLAKRMTERYATVADFAEELRTWLESRRTAETPVEEGSGEPLPADASTSGQRTRSERTLPRAKVVPKGLRSYGSRDADFFLELLPGPRDADGLPESLRFWKQVFEATEADNTAAVGLLYGPSGCGKSSFLKAGLIPRLALHVVTLYVEATPDDFEKRLLTRLRNEFPGLRPDGGLAETWLTLRDGGILPPDRKVVVIIDQFEQWLHAHRHEEDTELLRALRHCDGARVQCLLAVRDDFGMAATRFMGDLEIPIVQGRNFATIDRFSPAHARKVLADFGRAFGQLSESDADRTAAHERFLEQAVAGLLEDGKVIPVRLSLFAEMVKDRPWVPQTLATVGGAEGVGVAFLEETFASRSANPTHRLHQDAARRMLRSLLPEQGTDIRGSRVGAQALCEASGYAEDPRQFEAILRILDSELRLITPVEDPESTQGIESTRTAQSSGRHEKFYQLTHDYLVTSIRKWLTRAQRETRRGRIELQLAEQAALWNVKPVSGLLPSWWTWLSALVLVRGSHAGDAQKRMMRAATRHYTTVCATLAALLLLATLGSVWIRREMASAAEAAHARQLVRHLLSAEFSEVPAIVAEMKPPYRALVEPQLRAVFDEKHSAKDRLHAGVALLPGDDGQLPRLIETALALDPERLGVLANELAPHGDAVREASWPVAGGPERDRRLRAACLLARVAPDDPRWESIARNVSTDVVAAQPLLAAEWAKQLRPARRWLVPALIEIFSSPDSSEKSLAAALLAQYCDDALRLAELIESANHEQFRALRPALRAYGPELVPYLEAAMTRPSETVWPDDGPRDFERAPSPETVAVIGRAHGVVADRWAFCQTLPLADFEPISADLSAAGYRPNSLRPFRHGAETLVAAVWVRDGREWAWAHERTPAELEPIDDRNRAKPKRLVPFDIAATRPESPGSAEPPRFTALWVEPTADMFDAAMYVGVTEEQHMDRWKPLNERGFVPRTNLLTTAGPHTLCSSVRWKFSKSFEYEDCWKEPAKSTLLDDRGDWVQPDVRNTVDLGGLQVYSATWWNCGDWLTESVRELPLEAHAERCREFAKQGYRPATISVVSSADGRLVGTSSWRRPVLSEEQRTILASRQANAALALLQLEREESVWPHLAMQPDPTLRSLLIHGFARTEVDPRRLWKRLEIESDTSARRALLLGLSRYATTPSGYSPPTPADIEIVRTFFRDDGDPGVHSAAQHLLSVLRVDAPPLPKYDAPPVPGRLWSQTAEGQTLAHISGPIEFAMGSSPHEAHHESIKERQHQVRIDRSFAIGVTEVTVEEFLRFQPETDYARDYAPERNCPMTTITYFDAMRYCRWLSQQEGLSEDEMCYPPLDKFPAEIDDKHPLPRGALGIKADCLKKTGYRLPTAAEWEFAARAGTITSRPFGAAEELLPEYAWTAQTSRYRSRPVGQLLPSELGLFDILGNAMEYCQNTFLEYDRTRPGMVRVDRFDSEALEYKPNSISDLRERRGGAFLHQPADARPAHRDPGDPTSHHPFMGFRIARTLRP